MRVGVKASYHRAVKVWRLLAHPEYRRALRFLVAASVEHDRTPLAHDYLTVLDVGANRGQFALVAARRFPQASLVCFEPQDGARRTLGRVLATHPRHRVVPTAVAASAGSSLFHVTKADDSSSLLPSTAYQVDLFPGTQVVGTLRVPTERLDVLVSPASLTAPVLLKIDVQGTEMEVLRGAEGLLAAIDTVLVECSFVQLYEGQAVADEVIRMLHAHGFGLTSVVAPTTDATGQLVQADFIFERCDAAHARGALLSRDARLPL